MRTLSSDVIAALQAGYIELAQLVLMEFPSGNVALNTTNWVLTWDGVDYRGTSGGIGNIAPIEDGGGEVRGLEVEIPGVSSASLALALDAEDEWQGTPVTIFTAIFNTTTHQILDALVEWAGTGDTMAIAEDGKRGSIVATIESAAVDLLHGTPLTYSDADQQEIYPGDRFFEYGVSQTNQPIVWPSKEFFRR